MPEEVIPLEESDPQLAAAILAVVRGEHPVKSFSCIGSQRIYHFGDGSYEVHGTGFSRRVSATGGVTVLSSTGPNDRCPCGSGKKYKKCCGKT